MVRDFNIQEQSSPATPSTTLPDLTPQTHDDSPKPKQTRQKILVPFKLKCCDLVRSGISISQVSRTHNVSRATIRDWLKHEEKLRSSPGQNTRCRVRAKPTYAKYPELDRRLMERVAELRSQNRTISYILLHREALDISNKLNIQGFTASNQFVHRFMRRNGLTLKK